MSETSTSQDPVSYYIDHTIYTCLLYTSIIASKKAGNVIGVELNQDAVRDAINNAKMDQISNIRFFSSQSSQLQSLCIQFLRLDRI